MKAMYWNWIINLVESNWNWIISTFHQDQRFFLRWEGMWKCSHGSQFDLKWLHAGEERICEDGMMTVMSGEQSHGPQKGCESHCSHPSWVGGSWQGWESQAAGLVPRQGLLLLQEGGPFPGPGSGLLSNTWKWIVRGDTCAEKARDFSGKGHLGGEQQSKGTQEDCSAMGLAASGFMVMGLISGLSLANHSDSESFLVGQALIREVVGRVVSPFDLSWTLLVGGGLLVPCSLPGPPVLKPRMQMVTMVPGQGGWFQSECFL